MNLPKEIVDKLEEVLTSEELDSQRISAIHARNLLIQQLDFPSDSDDEEPIEIEKQQRY